MTAAHRGLAEPNDPTRSGPPLPSGTGARLSRNEIEQLCLKAARGAGMSWGLAEEAGFAAAWLAMRGLDGPGALLAQLREAEGRAWREICPVVAQGAWRAENGGRLCPIALGAAICDFAMLPETATGSSLCVGPVNRPVLLLPFLSDFARIRAATVQLGWPRGSVVITTGGRISGDSQALAQATTLCADLTVDAVRSDQGPAAVQPLYVPSDTLSGLDAFALRTTVPPSEASRAGAGAATNDSE